jgi:hypothetical protein
MTDTGSNPIPLQKAYQPIKASNKRSSISPLEEENCGRVVETL